MATNPKAQINQIGAEDFGVVEAVVEEGKVEVEGIWGILVEEIVEQLEDEVDEEEWPIVILWRVTSVGCVAIWPVTVPAPVHSQ